MNLNTFCEGEPHNSKSSIPDIKVICPLCMMYQLIVVSMYCQSSCVFLLCQSTLSVYFLFLFCFPTLFFYFYKCLHKGKANPLTKFWSTVKMRSLLMIWWVIWIVNSNVKQYNFRVLQRLFECDFRIHVIRLSWQIGNFLCSVKFMILE